MDRIIKFRGQNPYTKEWIYGYYFVTTQLGIDHPQIWQEDGVPLPVDPKTVGQYIGITDKHDKEIYEGDIIRMADATAKVVFWEQPPSFGLDFYHNEDKWCEDWNLTDDSDRMEIIGNIYDNPDLL